MVRTALIVCLLIARLALSHPHPHPSSARPLQLALLPTKENANYQYSITNYANSATVIRNDDGTFLQGDFSTLRLYTQRSEYEYRSTSLAFKYPSQHRVAELNNQMLELQILYELTPNHNTKWKHRRVGLSVTFLLTEYAPQQVFTLGHQITPNLQNGTQFDLQKLLPLVSGLNMFLYKGTHTAFPHDNAFMWLVRKELLLMSEFELEQVKSFIFQHQASERLNNHGLLARVSSLNEISEAKAKAVPVSDD